MLNRYEIFSGQKDVYWFVSTGNHGNIYKAVLFQQLPEHERFNLAMGDINLVTGVMEFDELSGNRDARKIFATIAGIVDEYTSNYADREILIAGNTNDKRRSYSFMVSRYLEEIILDFDIWGANQGGKFDYFEKSKVYDAILVKRK